MGKVRPEDHPDFIGGWKWSKLELDWINERIGTLEAALFQAQEAAKDLESRLTKTEGWLNEAMWNYGELKREQLANHPCRVLLDDDFYVAAGTDYDKLWLGHLSGEGGDFDRGEIRELLVKFYEENF